MKILLISPQLTKRTPEVYNIGLGYIGGTLIKEGYDVSLLDFEAYKYTPEEIKVKIKNSDADVICIGTLVTGFNYVEWLCNLIKELKPNVPIILGNSIATTIPEIAVQNLNVDYLVVGEGEKTIVELLQAIKNNSPKSVVDGIVYRENGKTIITKERELIQDIDTIPYPAWHLFPLKEIYFKSKFSNAKMKSPVGYISTTRGCPYKCTFCYHPFQNRKIRFHSAQRVVSEIQYLIENYQIKSLAFADDLFVIKKSRLYEIFDLMEKEKIKLNWRTSCRVDLVEEDLIKRMKSVGCVELGIGVESGSQTILNNIQKQTTVEDGARALSICKKLNIETRASFMIGNVGETRETVNETLKFRKKYKPGMGGFFYATPYPATELYEYAIKNNLVKDELALIKSYGEQSEKILVNFTNMSNSELEALKKYANKELIKDYCLKNPVKGAYHVGKAVLKKFTS